MAERKRTLGITAQRPALPGLKATDLSSSFFSISKFFGDLKDKEDARFGTEQGAAEALANSVTINGEQIPTFQKTTGSGPFATAFNKAGTAVFGARMDLAIREKARELSLKHPLNPGQMQTEMDKYVAGIGAAAPIELRAFFELHGAKIIAPRVDKAVGRVLKLRAADNVATLDAALASVTADAQEFAAQVAAGGPGAARALANITEGTKQYFDTVINAIDGQTFTAGMARQRIAAYQSEVFKRVLMGMFDGADDKLTFMEKFAKGEFNGKVTMDIPVLTDQGKIEIKKGANVIGMMKPEALNFVRSYMDMRVNDIAGAAKQRLDETARQREVKREAIGNDFMSRLFDDSKPPLTEAAVLASDLKPDTKKMYIGLIDKELKGKFESVNAVYNDLFIRVSSLDIAPDQFQEKVLPFVGHGITPDGYRTLRDFALKMEGETEGLSLKNFLIASRSVITASTLFGKKDPIGDKMYFAFTEHLTRLIEVQRKQGVSLRDMMNPKSAEYLGPLMQLYTRSRKQVNKDISDRIRGTAKVFGGDFPQRGLGESPQEYFKRLGVR